VFCSGVLFFLISVFRIRQYVIDSIPQNLKLAVSAGVGMFLGIIALEEAKVVVDHPATLVTLGDLRNPEAVLMLLGFVLIAALNFRRVLGGTLIGILAATIIGLPFGLAKFTGTHAIGHVRMATESDVDISGAHPYWAYPFKDVAVVHNGQLTNYFQWKRRLERSGHRFQSECDSEIIAVYLAEKMAGGDSLEDAMHTSLEDLDGVFTYMAVTKDALGVAKDEMAAKPLVLYESDELVAMASEEIAIRAVLGREIDTYDPYESEVLVWTR